MVKPKLSLLDALAVKPTSICILNLQIMGRRLTVICADNPIRLLLSILEALTSMENVSIRIHNSHVELLKFK